jgi:hypothetical protein
MKKLSSLLAFAASVCFASLPLTARASLFDFSYSGDGVVANGVLTTGAFSDNVGGFGFAGWQIVGISGTRNGVAISGLWLDPNFPDPSVIGDVEFDNALLSAPLGFDYWGLSYTTVDGHEVNLFSQDSPAGGGYFDWEDGSGLFIPVTFDPAPVPDRANTAILLSCGLGLCALGALLRRSVRGLL